MNDYTVKVRAVGDTEWKKVDTYQVKVDEVRGINHHRENASLCYFDFSGKAEVAVTSHKETVRTAKVRPLSKGITPYVTGQTVTFVLDRPQNLSVEVNGDIFHNLHLFANPIDSGKPENTDDPNLIYFAPGIHSIQGGVLNVPSGKRVYIAGGAIVKGSIEMDKVHDVKISGRGEVRPEQPRAGIRIADSENIEVEGIITNQCPVGGSRNVTIRNVKAISAHKWGDGMNVFASNDVLFDGVFCRNSDDCTTVYGTRAGFTGGCKNITMRNSTLWADVAHPIFIGIHGNVDNPETLENLNYVNIDILDHKEKQLNYQGCLAINAGDENLIRNVRFEDIRIENFRQGQLLNLRIFFNKKYCKAPGRGIENVLFKNISYKGENAGISMIMGYDNERKIKNVRFENLTVNGTRISDNMPDKPGWYQTGDMCNIFVGEHTENVTFH